MGERLTNKVTAPDLIVSLLAFSAGSADVFSFLKFHGVFTSAMTGNTALLGLALGQGHIVAALRSVAALVGFAIGNVIGTLLYDKKDWSSPGARIRAMLGIECVILAAVLVFWVVAPPPLLPSVLDGLIVIAASAMGVQSVVARTIDLQGISTVVFTTVLTLIMMTLTRFAVGREKLRTVTTVTFRQGGAMANYLLGAVLSGFLAVAGPRLLAIPEMIAVLLAFGIAFRLA